MEIRDLEYFLACCETRNFTAAARQVHIVQSAMSAAIARLEQEVGASLFDRSVTPVAITEHGAALQAGARRILDALRAVLEGSVDIALTASAAGPPPAGVVLHPLASEALVFVCRPDHPLSGRPRVTAPDLAAETILRFPPGWGVRAAVDRVLGEAPGAAEIADYTLMTKLVRAGFGTTLMPASAVNGIDSGTQAVPVDDARLRWSLMIDRAE